MPTPQLDATDWRLLDQLQLDASLSNQALAELVHISPATCLRRVKRLAEGGFIERRIAILSADRLGAGLTAVVEITLDHQGDERMASFEAKAQAEAAVQQCYRTSSGPDFVLIVQVRDMEAYYALVQRLFTSDVNVRNVKTYFSIKRSKFEPSIALPATPR